MYAYVININIPNICDSEKAFNYQIMKQNQIVRGTRMYYNNKLL